MATLTCPACGKKQDADRISGDGSYRCSACDGILVVDLTRESSEPSPAPRKPESPVFGKYRLKRELGRGAAGVVYEALDTTLRRDVALKIMSGREGATPHEDVGEWQRFMREAQLTANLSAHPNIVTVFEAGVINGSRYIAMEQVRGRPLSDVESSGVRDRIRMLRDLARALHQAHEAGIIHRDLKPQNVLVDEGGKPVLTDFGLAKRVMGSGAGTLTPSGEIMGTPHYMSPEQAKSLEVVDRRTDVYSLGVMLYEILAGRVPYDAARPIEVVSKMLQSSAPPPSVTAKKHGLAVAALELDSVCMKAIAKSPDDRHPTAEAFGEDLTAWLEGGGAAPRANFRNLWVAAAAIAVTVIAFLMIGLVGDDPPPVVPPPRSADAPPVEGRTVLVVGDGGRSPVDAALCRRLIGLGHDVVFREQGPLAGARMIVVSPSRLGRGWERVTRDSSVPMLVCDPYSLDDLGLAGASFGEDRGIASRPAIVDANAGGGEGKALYAEATSVVWARPASGSRIWAHVDGDPRKAVAFTREAGDPSVRTAALALPEGPTPRLEEGGWSLFDALVRWCSPEASK